MSDQTNALATRKPTALDTFRAFIRREDVMTRFEEILGSDAARPFVNSIIIAVANSPALQECTLASIITAASRAAMLRLSVNDNTGQAWIIPYGKVARFQPGWKGLRDMALEGGKVRYLNVGELYEGEYIEIDRLTGAAELKGGRTGNKIHSLFVYFQDIYGFKKTIVRTLDEIHAHAKLYNPGGYASKDGPWQSSKPRTVRGMEKKTVLTEMIMAWVPLDPYKKKLINTYEQMPDEDLGIVDAQFSPEPAPVKSERTLMAEMGYDEDEAPEAVATSSMKSQPEPQEVPAMTYATAKTVMNDSGAVYDTMDDATLVKQVQYLQQSIRTTTDDERRIESQFRLSAVNAIQTDRLSKAQ